MPTSFRRDGWRSAEALLWVSVNLGGLVCNSEMMGLIDRRMDRILLLAVGRGDERALERLYRRHAGFLAARLLGRGSLPDEVEEILQDTFVAVWRTPSSFRGEGSVGAWLWGIARNKQLEVFRSRARVPVPVGLPDHLAFDAEDHWVYRLDAAAVLESLDSDLRQTLEAVAVRGLSVSQAATELGIPEGTIKSRLHRARLIIERGTT